MPELKRRRPPATPGREVRRYAASDLEVRDDSGEGGDGTLTFTGYASVFDQPYEMYGGPPYGWLEEVDRHAFDETLSQSPDVQLLVNHEGLPLARTKSGTLTLAADDHGLKVEARLDASDPDVTRLVPKVQRGDMDQMSFAFRTVKQEWDEEETERRLLELNIHKGDVSAVNYGASPTTEFDLRALLAEDPDRVLAEIRSADPDLHVAIRAALPDGDEFVAELKRWAEANAPRSETGGTPLGLAQALATSLD